MVAGLIAVALVGFYILPSIIAFCREHDRTSSIIVLNMLIGWTVFGWILALAWACTQAVPRPGRAIANTLLMVRKYRGSQAPRPFNPATIKSNDRGAGAGRSCIRRVTCNCAFRFTRALSAKHLADTRPVTATGW